MRVPSLVLASASPRRRHLLVSLGLEVEVRPADVDETPGPDEPAAQLAARLACAKADAVALSLDARAASPLIIAADTVVVCDARPLGKPRDAEENRAFLTRLSGRAHEVVTGHHLRRGADFQAVCVRTTVRMADLDADTIARYVASDEGSDKAGGYALQGRGAALVEGIDGCWTNVVGLSLHAVRGAAARLGVQLV